MTEAPTVGLRRGWVLPTLAVAAVMGVALGRFALAGGGGAPAPVAPARTGSGSAAVAVADLQSRLRSAPDDPNLLTRLGEAYLLRPGRPPTLPGSPGRARRSIAASRWLPTAPPPSPASGSWP